MYKSFDINISSWKSVYYCTKLQHILMSVERAAQLMNRSHQQNMLILSDFFIWVKFNFFILCVKSTYRWLNTMAVRALQLHLHPAESVLKHLHTAITNRDVLLSSGKINVWNCCVCVGGCVWMIPLPLSTIWTGNITDLMWEMLFVVFKKGV